MDRETNDIVARLYLGDIGLSLLEPRDFAVWADLELQRGHKSDGLQRLVKVSTDEEVSAIEQKFRECVAELGWEVPGRKAALKGHAESIMQSIVDGGIGPYDGCSHLYIISIYLGHPDYLYNWNGLFWGREDFAEDELNELILDEARRTLAGEVIPINASLPHHDEKDEVSPGFFERLNRLIEWR